MKFLTKLAALAALSAPLLASAGVIYEWRSTGHETGGIGLRLEFDTAAVQSGSLVFDVEPDYINEPRPDSGLLSLSYWFPKHQMAMTYRPREQGFGYGFGMMNMNLTFGSDGSLSGYILANNSETHFIMESQGSLFTMLDTNSDMGMWLEGCDENTPCNGATGYLQRLPQTSPFIDIQEVPEPASIALMGAGLLAGFVGRRRAKRTRA